LGQLVDQGYDPETGGFQWINDLANDRRVGQCKIVSLLLQCTEQTLHRPGKLWRDDDARSDRFISRRPRSAVEQDVGRPNPKGAREHGTYLEQQALSTKIQRIVADKHDAYL